MKFTKDEIDLCKKIAEKYRKEIELDDKLYWEDKIVTVETIHTTPENLDIYTVSFDKLVSADDDFFFLWQISDCLEFLKSKGWGRVIIDKDGKIDGVKAYHNRGFIPPHIQNGETVLEALLKIVLAALEEG